MAVSVASMVGFVGGQAVNESDLEADLAQAVALLLRYLLGLKHTAEDGTVTRLTATLDEPTKTWTWADPRPVEDDDRVPVELLDRATEQVASDLFQRRRAPGGVINTQFGGDQIAAQPARLDRDPMISAYRLLAHWVVPF